ncbi:hypothetical protein [Vibrio aestuarianus]|uniref:Uncharacterized protein n=1 Tax=Vibrio aestuarianus TaxID=28171 RepID=A0ABM9FQ03_9VIBR|nr:hypothetical protein [Vibrio aestuarianus]MDE1212588.1 hypothetical protein [Vibrio aestuarianus]MDE1216848.1 hypothetical protein [Vibrio aestuarianus]MDE1228444.1 hypothetical protein [Vibrio aestuarianus]MDE1256588.1 hypothetical protein [Vibrio aestuarianus]MDE1259666.1 hypothetical protein [Vibrio aestuarianus]
MYSNETLADLICHEEMIMEGLDKNFWRLIKLPSPQIWEHTTVDGEEYSWVLAIVGNHCIYFNGISCTYSIAQFNNYWEIGTVKKESENLHELMTEIVRSRFMRP